MTPHHLPKISITINAWCFNCPEIVPSGDDSYCKVTGKNFGESCSPYPDEKCLYYKEALNKAIKKFCISYSERENVLDKIIKHIIFDIDVAKSAINEKDAVLYQSRIKTLEHILGEITKLQQQEERQYD
jgi:hypothetical protein